MREILFRGKESRMAGHGGWHEGCLLLNPQFPRFGTIREYKWSGKEHQDSSKKDWIVDIKTVGQYTGLQDKNGVKIFEGDVVNVKGGECCYGVWEYDNDEVIEDIRHMGFYVWGNYEEIEIIDNIHDDKLEVQNG